MTELGPVTLHVYSLESTWFFGRLRSPQRTPGPHLQTLVWASIQLLLQLFSLHGFSNVWVQVQPRPAFQMVLWQRNFINFSSPLFFGPPSLLDHLLTGGMGLCGVCDFIGLHVLAKSKMDCYQLRWSLENHAQASFCMVTAVLMDDMTCTSTI